MQLTQIIRRSVAVVLAAGVITASAAAGGEPKNEWPFTRSVVARTGQAVTGVRPASDPVIQGEPKNEPPFTRPVSTGTGTTGATTLVIRSSGGFSWADAAIGLAAGIGFAATAAGALTLTHKSPRTA